MSKFKIFLNKIKPKKLSTKILLGIVVLFSLYTVINKNYDKEIREPFRLAIHNDDGNLKNTYLIAHEFSKYLVDTPWDHAFYPILILPNTQYYIGLDWLYDFINNKSNYFFITRKNILLIGLSEGKSIEEGIKNTLNELMEEMKKAKDVFLRMYPEDELLLQEFDSTMEQSIIEFIKQKKDNTENKPYYLQKYNYILKIDYIKSDNNIEISMYKKI